MRKSQSQDHKSTGTIIAEKARARANRLTGARREQLLKKGLANIYGADGNSKAHTGRA